jgi:hypothetical protein
MFRVVVLYEDTPDADSYAQHVELCRRVPNSTFRHGRIFGAPMGHAAHGYFAEWEFSDRESFEAATKSDEFMATGKDARDRALPRPTIEFVEVE